MPYGSRQNFVTCTETRGNNLTVDERAKIDAVVDTGIKGSVGGVVELSKSVVETELPEVAIEVVEILAENEQGRGRTSRAGTDPTAS